MISETSGATASAGRSPRFPLVPVAAGAAVLGAVALVEGLIHAPVRAFANLLLHNFYFLSLSLGALFFLAVLYLAEAGWFVVVRRVPEAMAMFVPVAAALMLPVFLGRRYLYPWSLPAAAQDPLLVEKAAWLEPTGFALRLLVVAVVWSFFAFYFRRISLTQDLPPDTPDETGGDDTGGLRERRRLKRVSAIFVPVFAVTFSVASFDWVMSLEPHWFSTMFAVYTFAGLFLGAIAAITAAVIVLRESGPLAGVVHDDHLHDLGKMLFAFSTFWAYIWVSQYLLIWYGNLPEEVTHYVLRTRDPWLGLFALNVVLNWGLPFLVLLGRRAKRSPRVLLAVAGVVLAGRWLDLHLLIRPPLAAGGPAPGWLEAASLLGYTGLFVLVVRWALTAAPAVPRRDPLLEESRTYHA